MKNATELGIKAKEILIKGEAVPESLVAKMIDEKVNSPECAHHGKFYSIHLFNSIVSHLKAIFLSNIRLRFRRLSVSK